MSAAAARGAYGLRMLGLPDDDGLREALVPVPHHWPGVRVELRDEVPARGPGAHHVDGDRVELRLAEDGRVTLDRRAATATFTGLGARPYDLVVHPGLAYIASVFSEWLGRHALHGGAFLAGDGAWAVLGGHEAGKSSTLAWLARSGHGVLADDVLVLEGETVFAGPRSIDLRAATARLPALGGPSSVVRGGLRQRMRPAATAASYPMRGWFAMTWGDDVEVRSIPAAERFSTLVENLHPTSSEARGGLFDLLSLPGYELSRPKRLSSLPEAATALLDVAADHDALAAPAG